MSIDKCTLVELQTIADTRGNLTIVEGGRHIPFEPRRVYYLYGVPEGRDRGGHSHRELQQLIIAVSGSFDVVIDDGQSKKVVRLDDPRYGLYICPMIWRELKSFSENAVCVVLASLHYDEDDYCRDYEAFVDASSSQ